MFVTNQYLTEYDPTIEDSYRKMIQIHGKNKYLQILDTAGREDYRAMRVQNLRHQNAAVVIYSITDRRSFEEADSFIELMKEEKGDSFPIILAGNKCDLENERAVTSQEGTQKANKYHVQFFETSAKQRINVDETFMKLAEMLAEN
jgi:small GTP-binding protein